MKKLFSVICICAMLIGMFAVGSFGASAVTASQTIVDVKSGDSVIYTLNLADVPEPVIGLDFSIYYDSDVFDVVSVADYNKASGAGKNIYVINSNIDGEVYANFANLDGIEFDTKHVFMKVEFKAKKTASAHISYYIRYMYGDSIFDSADRPQISQYNFTCDVEVNGSDVLVDAQPELNVEEKQDTGLFVNSVNGRGEDADVNVVGEQNGGNSGNSGSGNNGNTGNGGNNGNTGNSGSGDVNPSSSAESVGATSASADIPAKTDDAKSTSDEAEDVSTDTPVTTTGTASGGSSAWIWIVIAAIVVIAGCGIVVFAVRSKKNKKAD